MYVALRRIRSVEKRGFFGNYNRATIKVKLMPGKEYFRLQTESQLQTIPVTQIKGNTLTVTLLNTHSLRKHLDDILSDKHLLCNDIMGLTETHLEVR